MRIKRLLAAAFLMLILVGCGNSKLVVKPGTKTGDVFTSPRDGAEAVWVPAGKFKMGSVNKDYPNENPLHEVYLDGYWIYKNEVTVAQYKKYCTETNRKMPDAPDKGWIDNYPIVNVTWQDAVNYAKWAGGSLPTEAQWEKAARGIDGREFPWGNQWDAAKCTDDPTALQTIKAVGSYPKGTSPYGCTDMAGNAIEWCADWFGPDYKNLPDKNPTGPTDGDYRVVRGGGWHAKKPELNSRCASRNPFDPEESSSRIGFRVVL